MEEEIQTYVSYVIIDLCRFLSKLRIERAEEMYRGE